MLIVRKIRNVCGFFLCVFYLFVCLFSVQERIDHGDLEFAHFSGKYLGIVNCCLLGVYVLGSLLCDARCYHCSDGNILFPLSY